MTSKKENKLALIAMIVMFVLVLTGAYLYWSGALQNAKNGTGNITNSGYVAAIGKQIYVVAPNNERIARMDKTAKGETVQAELVTDGPAMYLTVIEKELYYTSVETGYFMHYVEGGEDEVVLDYGCFAPQYTDHTLYFYSGLENLVYAITVNKGEFGEPYPLREDISSLCFTVRGKTVYYLSALDNCIWSWSINSADAPKKLTEPVGGYFVLEGGRLFYPALNENGEMALCSVKTDGTDNKVLVHSSSGGLNACGGTVYYTDVSGASGYALFGVRAKAKATPKQLTKEQAMDIQIVAGDLYYRTILDNGLMAWKRIPLTELGKDRPAQTVSIDADMPWDTEEN